VTPTDSEIPSANGYAPAAPPLDDQEVTLTPANFVEPIWVECKNTEAKATIEQVNTFVGKLVESRWKLGFLLSVAGFTKDATERLKNVGNNPAIPLIVPISGRDIDELLHHRTELQRFFKASIRRVA